MRDILVKRLYENYYLLPAWWVLGIILVKYFGCGNDLIIRFNSLFSQPFENPLGI